MAFWCRARDLGDLAHGCPRPAGARNVVRQALAGVGVEIDHAATHAIGLVEPDAILVVHADVPKRTGRDGSYGIGSPIRLVVAGSLHLALEIGSSDEWKHSSMQLGY